MQELDPFRAHRARPRGALLAAGLLLLLLGLAFVIWSSRNAPHTMQPIPSPQALP